MAVIRQVSFDVTCCTASILNLCVISIDRYLAITRPLTYGVSATTKRTLCFIAAIWVASCLISVPPLLLIGNEHGNDAQPVCIVSQNIGYQLYATLGAFYIPLTVMIVVYFRIYIAAKKVVEAELKAQPSSGRKPQPLLSKAKSRSSSTRSLSFRNDPATEVLNGNDNNCNTMMATTSHECSAENGHRRDHHSHLNVNKELLADNSNGASRTGLLNDHRDRERHLERFDSVSRRRASSALRERKASVTLVSFTYMSLVRHIKMSINHL